MYRQSILLTLLLSLVTACAEVEVRPLKPEEKIVNGVQGEYYLETKGVRFFRPVPYLWITVADKSTCQMAITYLPKMDEEFIIIPHPRMGSVTMAPTLTNGWSLTALSTTADSKASEMVTAIGNLTGNAANAAKGGMKILPVKEEGKEFGPGLYKFTFDAKGFISNLEAIFLQKGPDGINPATCADVRPPGEPVPGQPTPEPPDGKRPEK